MPQKSSTSRTNRNKRTESQAWLKRLAAVESPDVTFASERFPVVLKSGRGMRVRDVDGNRYLDFTACFGVLALGHHSPVIIQAMRKQTAKLIHGMGDVHPTPSKVRLLELIARITPFTRPKTILSLSGGEAVESALKTAMLATGRQRFVSFSGGYHGLQFGPLALADRAHFTKGFEAWTEGKCTVVPFPYHKAQFACGEEPLLPEFLTSQHGLVSSAESLTRLEDALKTKSCAALVLEPVQGRGGERTYPDGFVKAAADLARHYGSLVIFDEIFTGFGRTGSLFGFEHAKVTPDLLCLGKALGGGLPLSACVGDVMDVWGKSTGEARHTSTFLGHPLACGVGYAGVSAILKNLPEWQANMAGIDVEFSRFLKTCQAQGVAKVAPFEMRGTGYMRGLWFYRSPQGFAVWLAEELLALGFLVLPSGPRGDVLSLTPPLIATHVEFRKILNATAKLLGSLPPHLT